MIVAFCGHANFLKTQEYEQKILTFLENNIGDCPADMYLGDYGNFDAFAYECCKKYKATHPNISLIFITPYLTESFHRNRLQHLQDKYDFIFYPEIEDKPKRYAITYRNRYMVEKADYLIAYVSHDWGGAYQTYKYARRRGKNILNLASFD